MRGGARAPAAARAGLVRLTFLQVNDDYSLEPVDGGARGGMARLATLVQDARAANPRTLFVLGGDTLSPSVMSTFLKGEQMVAVFNAVGLDVATFGNHEFDFGPAVLRERMRESKFAWVSSNVTERATGQPFGGAKPSLLLPLGGVTVGVLGLTMAETAHTSSPGPDVAFEDAIVAGQRVAADLRARGAAVVIAITHQEMARDRELAAHADVDLVLGGHEHEPLIAEEAKALITKAGADGRYLVQVDLWLGTDGRPVERSFAFREVSRRVEPDPTVAEVVRAYTQRLDRELDVVVARTTEPLEAHGTKLRTEEANIGDFVADLMRERLGTDVAVMNGGGIRTDRTIPAGPLTKRDVMSLLPFTNVVVKLGMAGTALRAMLEHGLAQADRAGGGFLQISGARVLYDPGRPAFQRVVSVDVGGRPLEDARTYTVAVPSYLAHGGDGFTAFRGARVLVDDQSGPQLSDVVLDALTARGTIGPRVDGRIGVRR
ncbi:MAG: bifunctional metallophosphatase/5'-nucleotidase [Candidatus Rokubacteria bacterium]|nr:bifunctional metallophosphatase/5'-nucleotidase [Candidatus Rokubacteria bacterium]